MIAAGGAPRRCANRVRAKLLLEYDGALSSPGAPTGLKAVMKQFSEGDIVRVKCGGPEMTVLCVDGDYFAQEDNRTAVFCVYEKDHYLFEQAYPEYALDIIRYERRRFPREA